MRHLLFVSALLTLAACAGRPPGTEPSDALIDMWAAIPAGMSQLAAADVPAVCDRPFGTWFEDFGVRGLACSANRKLPLAGVVARAPMPIWTSGPHQGTPESLGLALHAPREFGQYNPAFVQWAVENGVPESAAARTLAQPIYDAYVRRLARVYWLAYQSLAGDGFPARLPTGPVASYAAFLDGGPLPEGALFEDGVSVFLLFDARSQPIADRLETPADNPWEIRYEANTALGFWVRRRADGTVGLFRDGLRDVLDAFDADWLAANGG